MVAMSGAIMPEPLAMPLMVTLTPSIIGGGGGQLGIGVGGHDGFGGGAPAAGRALRHQPRQHAGDLFGGQRLADHPGGGHEDLLRRGSRRRRRPRRRSRATPSCPALPVKALALPLLTTSTRAAPPLSLSRHQIHRRRGGLGLGEDPGHLGSRRQSASSTSVRCCIADPGRPRRQPHPGQRRQLGEGSWAPAARRGHRARRLCAGSLLSPLCAALAIAACPGTGFAVRRGTMARKSPEFDKGVARFLCLPRGRHADLAAFAEPARLTGPMSEDFMLGFNASPNVFRLGQRAQGQAAHGQPWPRSMPWSPASRPCRTTSCRP